MAKLTIRDDADADPLRGAANGTARAADIPPVDVARETRLGRIFGGAAILSVLLTLASLLVQGSSIPRREGNQEPNDRTQLFDVGGGGDGLLVSQYLRALSVLLIIAVAWFLYDAIRGRNPSFSVWVPRAGTLAFAATAVVLILGFYEVRDVADEFLGSGPRSLERAESLLDEARDGTLGTINLVTVLAGLVSGIWLSITSLEAGRVGLLTRFLSVFGIGAGLATAIPGLGIGPYLMLGWLGSVGAIAVGYWPGGRPPAWEAGRAMSWDEIEAQERGARIERRERRNEG
ncbi:hypothetical protein GKE82_16830 [Conexibacter sp. W3-3-2]|uniref:hypothetical protein n=1 Tax=Conexibacter sp. W3-3-2 TaxID=2675227 RepID=UPI0012B7E345|nr:hypothetical protein [Conexibacter sp. W3-3-2]MTD45907.1 hypothetical protein [Conexibacter sp. W3-3-2]